MPGLHALLSPSSAHRWLNCTVSPRLEEGVEDKSSIFAEEGTLAHAYCAMKLKNILGLPIEEEQREIAQYASLHTGEMDEYTDTYVAIVMEKFNRAKQTTPDAKLLVETRLDFSEYIPDSFGTGDAVIIADGVMEIIDFKYGKGIKVSAYKNPQMMIYALGACRSFSFDYDICKVRMTIVQPRIDNLSEYELPVDELLDWAKNVLMPAAADAYAGRGVQNPGEWCQFCKVKARCKALADDTIKTVEWRPDARLINKEDMEVILPKLATIKTWVAGIEEFALAQALSGTDFKGFKVVEGRSVRKITDQEEVRAILSDSGYDEELFMKPAELRGIGDIEKIVGKKKFAELCGDYIVKPQGKPTLAPETDKRAAYNSAHDDFKDIK